MIYYPILFYVILRDCTIQRMKGKSLGFGEEEGG